MTGSVAMARPLSAAEADPVGMPPRRSLRALLLLNLGLFTALAVILVSVSTVVASGVASPDALGGIVLLWLWSSIVTMAFGWLLVRRLILGPVRQLAEEVRRLAEPGAAPSEAAYETAEFDELARAFREMATAVTDAERAAQRAEKLASIGRLAAGVAHEVRNPLGALSTYTDVLHQRGRERDVSEPMRGAIARIERIVQGLLTYARPGAAQGEFDLNAAVENIRAMLASQPAVAERVVEVTLAPGLGPVRGSAHAVEQVILNLVMNAMQAAAEGPISVATLPYEVGASLALPRPRTGEAGLPQVQRRSRSREPRRRELPAGTTGVLLMVSDQGPGIAPEDRDRIFDAFYTTKSPGQGVGLGLAIVASTVEDAGGLVWVDEARGGGAAFKVFLPFAGRAHAAADR
jgi:signal transduction histidine kinase